MSCIERSSVSHISIVLNNPTIVWFLISFIVCGMLFQLQQEYMPRENTYSIYIFVKWNISFEYICSHFGAFAAYLTSLSVIVCLLSWSSRQ